MERDSQTIVMTIVVRGDKVLMIRRASSSDGLSWAFPGGKVRVGESIETAGCRELFEEARVHCERVTRLGSRIHPQTGRKVYYLTCLDSSGEGRVGEPTKISDVRWMTPEEVEKSVTTDLYQPVREFIRENALVPRSSQRAGAGSL